MVTLGNKIGFTEFKKTPPQAVVTPECFDASSSRMKKLAQLSLASILTQYH